MVRAVISSNCLPEDTLYLAQGMAIMSSLFKFRVAASFLLTLFFGYIAPCLNTVKAVLDRDAKAVKEYLTYWVVFLITVYLGRVINFLSSAHRSHPPELKVLFVLWLTLPQFQGALRIYIYIIKPYFDKYEEHIDNGITTVATEVKSRASRQIKVILWQLFLSPNDGVLTAAISGVNTLIGNKQQFSWPSFFNPTHNSADSVPAVNLSSAALSRHLVSEFSKILTDGMYLEVWQGHEEEIMPCEVQLLANNKILGVSIARGDFGGNGNPLITTTTTTTITTTTTTVSDEYVSTSSLDSISNSTVSRKDPEDAVSGKGDPSLAFSRESIRLRVSYEDLQSGYDAAVNRQTRKDSFTKSRLLSSINVTRDLSALKIPLMLIADVSADNDQSLVVSLSIPVDILSPETCFAFAGMFLRCESGTSLSDSINDDSIVFDQFDQTPFVTSSNINTVNERGAYGQKAPKLCRMATLCLLAEGVEEAEALQVGLQLLIRAAKSQGSRALQKVLRNGSAPRRAVSIAFKRWVTTHIVSQQNNNNLHFPDDGSINDDLGLGLPHGLEIDDNYSHHTASSIHHTPGASSRGRVSSVLASSLRVSASARKEEDQQQHQHQHQLTESSSDDDYGEIEPILDEIDEVQYCSPANSNKDPVVHSNDIIMSAGAAVGDGSDGGGGDGSGDGSGGGGEEESLLEADMDEYYFEQMLLNSSLSRDDGGHDYSDDAAAYDAQHVRQSMATSEGNYDHGTLTTMARNRAGSNNAATISGRDCGTSAEKDSFERTTGDMNVFGYNYDEEDSVIEL